jgi:hypothetical protein
MKLGRFIKVIEKWVFFKLLFANLTDSSGGKNHTFHYVFAVHLYPEIHKAWSYEQKYVLIYHQHC